MNSQPQVLARPPPWRTQSDARAFPGVTGKIAAPPNLLGAPAPIHLSG